MEKERFIDNQFEDNNYLICEACGNKMTENKCKLKCERSLKSAEFSLWLFCCEFSRRPQNYKQLEEFCGRCGYFRSCSDLF